MRRTVPLGFDNQAPGDRGGAGNRFGRRRLVDELLANSVTSFGSGGNLPVSGEAADSR